MTTAAATPRPVDTDKLHQLLHQAVVDMGAAMQSTLILIGDRLGLYRAMGDCAPVSAAELARRTGTDERYIREWLNANAAGKYIEYDAPSDTYSMTPEQSFALAQDDTAVHLPGFYHMLASCMKDEEKLTDIFRTGKGFGWHEHEKGLFEGCERFFRPSYLANLTTSWIPALEGVEEKLKTGARVADIGCGHGASTLLMAKTYPKSEFFGFDYHDKSIEQASEKAKSAGCSDRVHFDVAPAKSFPGKDYDFVACFDCLHDMGDPTGAAAHVKQSLANNGTWMIVEPIAGDDITSNLNPIGRIYYAASTIVCVPASRSQEVGLGLGAQAGEKRIRQVVTEGGFTHFRRASETPFNMVFEARA
ncbi:class I SAM-dependent methyltransferase [Alloacidobacterium sp.]|uniref:class I SAM-dependent methyltransferase n=1 Tax=Alloacidobacterium sp. TaxID=2951999 RepID=UPI002D290A10|nr:class I SAM-dependent methyltransferase [Alloacidobacterium sp.]HYK37706.1 class I SAM-dependent methyltransferase [Alloacidobacterium sp.]